jgi:ubiquilin
MLIIDSARTANGSVLNNIGQPAQTSGPAGQLPMFPFTQLQPALNGQQHRIETPSLFGLPSQSSQASPSTNISNSATGNATGQLPPLPFGLLNPFMNMNIQSPLMPVSTSTAVQQPANQEPPEVRFSKQLSELEEMGFTDRQTNIRALLASVLFLIVCINLIVGRRCQWSRNIYAWKLTK